MNIYSTKGMLKAFLLSSLSLNCWSATNSATGCGGGGSGGSADVCPPPSTVVAVGPAIVTAVHVTPLAASGGGCSGGGSGSGSTCAAPSLPGTKPNTLSRDSAATKGSTEGSTESDSDGGSGSETSDSTETRRQTSDGSLSVRSATSPGRGGSEPKDPAAAASPPLDDLKKFIEDLKALPAHPERRKRVLNLFVTPDLLGSAADDRAESAASKAITISIDKISPAELSLFAEAIQSIRTLMPTAFQDELGGSTLSTLMSHISRFSRQEERTLFINQLKAVHKLDPDAFSYTKGGTTLVKLVSAMSRHSGAQRAKILSVIAPLIEHSLDKTEVIFLSCAMPETHLVPIRNQALRFIRDGIPPRHFGPIIRSMWNNFVPHIVELTTETLKITRIGRSSTYIAHVLESLSKIPPEHLTKIRVQASQLENTSLSGKDMGIIIEALAKVNLVHLEKVRHYTKLMSNAHMSGHDVSSIILAANTIIQASAEKPSFEAGMLGITKQFNQMLSHMRKPRHSETYGHMLISIAETPPDVVEEAIRYLSSPIHYFSNFKKRMESLKKRLPIDLITFQKALEEAQEEARRLVEIYHTKKAQAEKLAEEWAQILPITEEYATHEGKLEAIKAEAQAKQAAAEKIVQDLEAISPTINAEKMAAHMEDIRTQKNIIAEQQKIIRSATEELANSGNAKKIAMDVIAEKQLELGKKSTEVADANRDALIAQQRAIEAEHTLKELGEALPTLEENSARAIRLVDTILIPERILGRKVVRVAPTLDEEEEYWPGFAEAYRTPLTAAEQAQIHRFSMADPLQKTDAELLLVNNAMVKKEETPRPMRRSDY